MNRKPIYQRIKVYYSINNRYDNDDCDDIKHFFHK